MSIATSVVGGRRHTRQDRGGGRGESWNFFSSVPFPSLYPSIHPPPTPCINISLPPSLSAEQTTSPFICRCSRSRSVQSVANCSVVWWTLFFALLSPLPGQFPADPLCVHWRKINVSLLHLYTCTLFSIVTSLSIVCSRHFRKEKKKFFCSPSLLKRSAITESTQLFSRVESDFFEKK
jgi:hypothetical protein